MIYIPTRRVTSTPQIRHVENHDDLPLTSFFTLLESSTTRHFRQASNVHCLLAAPASVSVHAPQRQAPNLKSLTRLFLQATACAASPSGLEPGRDEGNLTAHHSMMVPLF
jgi:hypothetical protein